MRQLDIFGAEVTLGMAPPKVRDAIACEQPRLFEPQYEGQLGLNENDPHEAGRSQQLPPLTLGQMGEDR